MTPPTEILLDHAARALTLCWPDGDTQRIGYARLRSACPCAACRKIRLDGGQVDAPPDQTLDGVEAAGYGIRLLFGDGHARGIYPWAFLAELGAYETDAGAAAPDVPASGHPAN
ncbi:gamma-butyrobetaine hydroxylase-like domain-containing protein [Burkholderia sp. BCC1998]|uniref:gamma-butyrobetaine hydroxylase-like domain-containing protein n=1 Tax=Burkholderia sp. BCC1998 TaxID=2817447 RepID=UPI002AB68087|nr:gamma-butyrobetaine hydroxylase-like domain-containing protein [Burkholderia sp. BCC1998]